MECNKSRTNGEECLVSGLTQCKEFYHLDNQLWWLHFSMLFVVKRNPHLMSSLESSLSWQLSRLLTSCAQCHSQFSFIFDFTWFFSFSQFFFSRNLISRSLVTPPFWSRLMNPLIKSIRQCLCCNLLEERFAENCSCGTAWRKMRVLIEILHNKILSSPKKFFPKGIEVLVSSQRWKSLENLIANKNNTHNRSLVVAFSL